MSGRGRPRTRDILTLREWEVLELLRAGLSNREIADRLQLSLAGAKYHVSEIISKLGVSSREEAAAWRPHRRRLPLWLAPLTALRALPIVVGAISLAAAFVVILAAGASPSSGPSADEASAPPTSMPGIEPLPTVRPSSQPPWTFQGPTTALPALDEPTDGAFGYVTPTRPIVGIAGARLSIDFLDDAGVREIPLMPGTEVFGAEGHRIVIDSDHSRLAAADEVTVRYNSQRPPGDPSTWRVLQVVRNYFKYKTGVVIAVGPDYLDILNLEPPLGEPGSTDIVTRVYVDPNARIETVGVDGVSLPPAPLLAIDVKPGMQATFEGVIADDGSPVAIWVQLY